jgi:hypothetical protein
LALSVSSLAGGKQLGGETEAGSGECSIGCSPAPPEDGGEDSSPSTDSSVGPNEASPTEASPPEDGGRAPVTCLGGPSSGGGGSDGSCEISASETCSDGTTYTMQCNCPQAMCSCTQMSATIGSSSTIPYDGCASGCTSLADALAACGFPQ